MPDDIRSIQSRLDAIADQLSNVRGPTLTDRVIECAKKGATHPTDLDEDDVRLVCRTLLSHYAQMGID